MKNLSFRSVPAIFLFLFLFVSLAVPQSTGHHLPTPPESMDPKPPVPPYNQPPAVPKLRVDLAQAQKEADDLARTAGTIPADVASLRKGILPKDVIEKLKQIEKLSKHLRSELNR